MRHKWNVPGILIILININNCIGKSNGVFREHSRIQNIKGAIFTLALIFCLPLSFSMTTLEILNHHTEFSYGLTSRWLYATL